MDLITTKGEMLATGVALLFGITYMIYYFIKYELPDMRKKKKEKEDINA